MLSLCYRCDYVLLPVQHTASTFGVTSDACPQRPSGTVALSPHKLQTHGIRISTLATIARYQQAHLNLLVLMLLYELDS